MKFPIITSDHGDLRVFSSAAELDLHLEPIDIRNGGYTAYDADGRLLRLKVDLVGPTWWGFRWLRKEVIGFETLEDAPTHRSELQDLVFDALSSRGWPMEYLSRQPLAVLIDKLEGGAS